jgi:hypothetical protein
VANVILLGDSAEVVSSAGSVIALLKKGDEFTIKKTVQLAGGRPCTTVTLPSGTTGFLYGDIPVRAVEQVKLAQAEAAIRERPEEKAPVRATLEQGALFWNLEKAGDAGSGWMRVRNEQGAIGYLDARTRFVKASAGTQALYAALAGFIAGAIFGVVEVFELPQTWRMVAFAITFMPVFGIKPFLSKAMGILAYFAGGVLITLTGRLLLRH